MSYYIRCPHCEAYLDPGEKCSCREENTTETMNMKTEENEDGKHEH